MIFQWAGGFREDRCWKPGLTLGCSGKEVEEYVCMHVCMIRNRPTYVMETGPGSLRENMYKKLHSEYLEKYKCIFQVSNA